MASNSPVPVVIRRSSEETTPNLHSQGLRVHFRDEKSQKISPRDTPAPLGRAGAFVGFASRHLLPTLAPILAYMKGVRTTVELHAKLVRGIQEGGIYRPLIDIT